MKPLLPIALLVLAGILWFRGWELGEQQGESGKGFSAIFYLAASVVITVISAHLFIYFV